MYSELRLTSTEKYQMLGFRFDGFYCEYLGKFAFSNTCVLVSRELFWLVFIGEIELLEPDFGMLFAENQCHVTVGGSNLLLCLPINF